jgi:hypothetical protein
MQMSKIFYGLKIFFDRRSGSGLLSTLWIRDPRSEILDKHTGPQHWVNKA